MEYFLLSGSGQAHRKFNGIKHEASDDKTQKSGINGRISAAPG
jgi:hypothetical protein